MTSEDFDYSAWYYYTAFIVLFCHILELYSVHFHSLWLCSKKSNPVPHTPPFVFHIQVLTWGWINDDRAENKSIILFILVSQCLIHTANEHLTDVTNYKYFQWSTIIKKMFTQESSPAWKIHSPAGCKINRTVLGSPTGQTISVSHSSLCCILYRCPWFLAGWICHLPIPQSERNGGLWSRPWRRLKAERKQLLKRRRMVKTSA